MGLVEMTAQVYMTPADDIFTCSLPFIESTAVPTYMQSNISMGKIYAPICATLLFFELYKQ